MTEKMTVSQMAEKLWEIAMDYTLDWAFIMEEYKVTEASIEEDAKAILEGENGEGYRNDIYSALEEEGYDPKEVEQDKLEAYMQATLIVELKRRLPAFQ
ncbi:MAG: hypothetical protein BWY23_02799 [Spirochaetes bacterium ADurb.Bin218]|nr:MAG: hypothetical protein BWY23_02799 [Spirochaetes bacterium ADurb.Bin218]